MSKLRVHDLASEFGIAGDELIALLRQMDIPVRSHLSALAEDQIARIRARWEREKRARTEKPADKSSAAARRRRAGTGAPPAASEPPPVAEAAPGVRRRRRVEPPPPAEVTAYPPAEPAPADAPAITPSVGEALPVAPAAPALTPAVPPPAAVPAAAAPVTPGAPAASAPPLAAPPGRPGPTPMAPPAPTPAPPAAPDRPRPRPIVPGAPRPRPGGGLGVGGYPRPVASAAPGVGLPPRERRPGTGIGGGLGGPSIGGGAPSSGPRRKKGKRGVDQEAVSANITKTMRELQGRQARRGPRRPDDAAEREALEAMRAAEVERERKTVRVNEFITVSELAEILKVPATQIVGFAFKSLGLMVTINQRLDFDQIELIAGEFGFQAVKEEEYAVGEAAAAVADAPETLRPRPPVVTIMGHVDHGKTSLLDYIRRANVVAGEAGGITQHIGAYHVTLPDGKAITFLDTPGHEAFTAMRARGAQVTDIVVLVVAADDSVMPQTIEAISHARNAGVPIIVAINKIDLPQANPLKVKQELLNHGVVLEDFGGTTLATEISAKQGTNVPALLEQVLLQAELLELTANPDRRAQGTVIEAQLDPGKGPVATVLVQHGTLRVGDDFICGMVDGRVRALLDERGKPVKEAGPAIPVQVLGLKGVPMAGDQLLVVADANEAREIASRRERLDREAKSRRQAKGAVSLEEFMAQAGSGEKRTLKLLIKADQGGPAEALADALAHLSNDEVSVEVVQRAVGAITESDILLAKAAGAIIVGFHVRPDAKARQMAEREGVDIKLYRIIYEAVADVRAALEGLLRPEQREVVVGEAEVRETFKVPKVGVIAGCYVRAGVISRQGRARVVRDGVVVYEGTLGSLRRFKDDVREVKEGFECGIGVENFNDVKVGDVIEVFRTEEVARTLAPAASSPA